MHDGNRTVILFRPPRRLSQIVSSGCNKCSVEGMAARPCAAIVITLGLLWSAPDKCLPANVYLSTC